MEYAEKGDLSKVLRQMRLSNTVIPESKIKTWLIQLAQALSYLHGSQIIHRDVKPQNIMVTQDNTIKLGDFGISKTLTKSKEYTGTSTGTPYFLSPEICKGENYDYKTDIWMLGCTIYEIMTDTKPFKGHNFLELMKNIILTEVDYSKISRDYSGELIFLLKQMLVKDQKSRIGIRDILNSSYLKSYLSSRPEASIKSKRELKIDTCSIPGDYYSNENINTLNRNKDDIFKKKKLLLKSLIPQPPKTMKNRISKKPVNSMLQNKPLKKETSMDKLKRKDYQLNFESELSQRQIIPSGNSNALVTDKNVPYSRPRISRKLSTDFLFRNPLNGFHDNSKLVESNRVENGFIARKSKRLNSFNYNSFEKGGTNCLRINDNGDKLDCMNLNSIIKIRKISSSSVANRPMHKRSSSRQITIDMSMDSYNNKIHIENFTESTLKSSANILKRPRSERNVLHFA